VKKGCLGINMNGLREKGYVINLTFTCKTRNKFTDIVNICQVSPLTIQVGESAAVEVQIPTSYQ